MSHQSGIQGATSLLKSFSDARAANSHIRLLKVAIDNEQLVAVHHATATKSWQDDYENSMIPCLNQAEPCYIFFRLDSKNANGYEWLFISWIPDDASVRQKMLYASTRATLKREFGGTYIKDELSGTVPSDLSMAGYKRHVQTAGAPAPLTNAEQELSDIKKSQTGVEIGVDTKHQTISGVGFPVSSEAQHAIKDLKSGKVNIVLFSLDLTKEVVNLEAARKGHLQDLSRIITKEQGRYALVSYPHSYEGDHFDSLVFIYSMPSSGCSIKERMLYSSCKNPLIHTIEAELGVVISKRIETDDPSEINEEYIRDQIHPKIHLHQPLFAKPKGPPSRGNKRIAKPE
ncbi:Twinfilin-2 [Hypsibius exemplaris]|uniref:Twinfilin n=1 Tax=Hypsibius exemplaris TaxID=2072580 RepID=A0A1W0X8M6_HYPEX|nr:Twinfilin-2 [Hypsibius exemplaris]